MKKIFALLSVSLPIFLPEPIFAHSFGKLYSLPVPFWLYLYGGAAAILLSFFVIGYFFNKPSQKFSYPTIDLSKFSFFACLMRPSFLAIVKVVSVLLFFLTIITGLFGENSAYSNFNMTFFWIIFVLGLTYMTALVGNIYAFINPWKILTNWLGGKTDGVRRYPNYLGYYPALFFYFLFIWFELVGKTTPFTLSSLITFYTVLNYFGVITFGEESWFGYCEFFSVFFRLVGKMAPVEYRAGKLYLRPPFIGLLKEHAKHVSLVFFTLFMLSSTAFDGFKETAPWVQFYIRHFRSIPYPVIQTIGLLLSPVLFLGIYIVLLVCVKIFAKSSNPLKDLVLQFAFSLIPIALVYHIAHYYTLIFTEGPNIIRLISDPFGFGWNVFNTGNYSHSIILSANFIWHSQVVFILLGHIIGVYLAHLVSLNIFYKRVLVSQFPMLILMVAYTMIGLWILSQPITGGTL
ncbi:hypothetical protein HY949_04530 [Candidatus Gottesmanbacteria bacterium]|nr:hypothetical protein [Candidatus Gottesmanbacteria bacterium]